MSSPGSGKTTTLSRTIERLKDEMKILGVMEADIDSDVDAKTIASLGVKRQSKLILEACAIWMQI